MGHTMTPERRSVDLPRTPAALRKCIDETLERVGRGEQDDRFLRAAWYLLCVERGHEMGLDDERTFVRYFLENYVWTFAGRRDEHLSAQIERVLERIEVDGIDEYVRRHPYRNAADTMLRWVRGETS